MNDTVETEVTRSSWRPLYWEPVIGTGERMMVGVVYSFRNEYGARKTLRSDVLSCLYGKSAESLEKLIDHSIHSFANAADISKGLSDINFSISGIHPGEKRDLKVNSLSDLLRVACLMCSSLASIDSLDDLDESDAPVPEQHNKRFSTEIRENVASRRADLVSYFNSGAKLVNGGEVVKFGFLSPKAIAHFCVIYPSRQGPSIRDSRARLFELSRVKEMTQIENVALIAGFSRDDDPTLTDGQRKKLNISRSEIEREADVVGLRWYPVTSAEEGASQLIELAG